MSKTVQKLNKLHNPESFIQVNTIKGFKYIDKAGEIVNKYHIKNKPPNFTMNPEALVIEKPQDKIDLLRVTATNFWLKFSKIDSLDMIIGLFQKNTKDVLETLEVTKLSRIGWRNYFIYEFVNDDKFKSYFANLQPIKNNDFISLTVSIKTNKSFKGNLTIVPVAKTDSKTKAILFDIDMFEEGDFAVQSIETKLKEFLTYLKAEDGFLEKINKSFT